MPSVRLYTRRGCHLCDVARATVDTVRGRHPFAFEELDVDASDHLIKEYGYRVPVVEVWVDGGAGDAAVFEIEVPEADLEALVAGR